MNLTPGQVDVAPLLLEADRLHRGGRRAEAELAYAKALQIAPNNVAALNNLGVVQLELGKAGHAIDTFRRLHQLRPGDAIVQFNLGRALLGSQASEEARPLLEAAVRAKPDLPEAQNCLGLARWAAGDRDGAIAAYASALRLRPDFTEALSNLIDVYVTENDWGPALVACDRMLAQFPGHVGAMYKKGFVLALQGDFATAERLTREVLHVVPKYAPAYNNLGAIATWQNKFDDAVREFRTALQYQPDFRDAELGLAHALLALGDFKQAWHHYEGRPAGIFALRKLSTKPPVWQGQPLPKGTLVVEGEAGLGDVLQFCRLIPVVRPRVGRLVLYLGAYYRPLARLLATLDGVDEVCTTNDCFRTADATVSVMSLPYLCGGAPLDRAPTPVPFLHIDPQLRERWTRRLAGDGALRVGIVWGGSARRGNVQANTIDRRRSIPIMALEALFDVEGVTFYSLQKGEAAEELAALRNADRIVDYTSELGDFMDTGALMSALDLVISVDTSVVHLAGALGKPTWMLNRFDSCWRWGPTRRDAPWYPSMRVFRQTSYGDWSPVVAATVHELRALAWAHAHGATTSVAAADVSSSSADANAGQ